MRTLPTPLPAPLPTTLPATVVALTVVAAVATLLAPVGPAAGGVPAPKPAPSATPSAPRSGPVAGETAHARAVPAASRSVLTDVEARIGAYAPGHHHTFARWADRRGDVVVVTDAPRVVTDRLLESAGARSPGVAVRVRRTASVVDTWHRNDDVAPFWGGGGLLSGSAVCSAGYAVRDRAGARALVTAGHCFPAGAAVRTRSGALPVGTVTGRTVAQLDAALLTGGSYAGRVFTGGPLSATSLPVVGAGGASVGYSGYCHSATTGEACGHTALSTTGQLCTATGCKAPVIVFGGGVMPGPGDSGGVFYAKDAAGAWIRGHVIGASAGAVPLGFAAPYAQVVARYGVVAVTG